MTWTDYHIQFMKSLDNQSDLDIVESFNKSVGMKAFGVARSAYLSALRKQFERRGFDCSMIADRKTECFKRKVKLYKGRLIPKNEEIIYIDSDELELGASNYVVKVDSVNKKFKSLDNFQQILDTSVRTNGHVVIVEDIHEASHKLYSIYYHKFNPNDFHELTDYLFFNEDEIKENKNRIKMKLNGSIQEIVFYDWLEVFIRPNGTFVRYVK